MIKMSICVEAIATPVDWSLDFSSMPRRVWPDEITAWSRSRSWRSSALIPLGSRVESSKSSAISRHSWSSCWSSCNSSTAPFLLTHRCVLQIHQVRPVPNRSLGLDEFVEPLPLASYDTFPRRCRCTLRLMILQKCWRILALGIYNYVFSAVWRIHFVSKFKDCLWILRTRTLFIWFFSILFFFCFAIPKNSFEWFKRDEYELILPAHLNNIF